MQLFSADALAVSKKLKTRKREKKVPQKSPALSLLIKVEVL